MNYFEKTQNLENLDGNFTGELNGGDSCRICLSKETPNNLYAKDICRCCIHNKVHVKCLILWLRQKSYIEKVPDQVFFIDWKTIKCEICNDWYPMEVMLNGNKVPIFQPTFAYDRFFFTFVIYSFNKKEIIGIFYLIPQHSQDIKYCIGQKPTAAIHLEDSMLNNENSFIFMTKKGLYIEDHDSTYGTLKKVE